MEGVDFGRTASDYGGHRQGHPEAFFERLAARGIGVAGQRVLDLGTGTGQMARGLARRGATVTGLDPSEALLETARRLDRLAGLDVAHRVGRAEETDLPDHSFDVVTAAQCWTWFDRPRVAREVRRLLAPGGRLVIAQLDWLPLPGTVAEATDGLILRYNPDWGLAGGDGFHPEFVRDVQMAGFRDIETFSFDLDLIYGHGDWRGRIRASAGIGASLDPKSCARFDHEHGAMLAERFPGDPLAVLHRVFAVLCSNPRALSPPPSAARRRRRG